MREIKFRVWDKKNRAWEKEYSCYGIGLDGTVVRHFDNDNIIIQQYTGLKDENGKEIYEGDIIQWSDDEGRRQAEVKYGIGEFDGGVYKYAGFYLEGDGRILEPYEITNMIKHKEYYSYKVVGNIFEGVDK